MRRVHTEPEAHRRVLWRTYPVAEKRKLIHDHAATVFEEVCRARFPGSRCYWERHVELDLAAPDPDDPNGIVVAEIKWRRLSIAERKVVLRQLEAKWSRCSLRARHPNVRFLVLDASILTG
jgi:hypothetical protein